MARIRHIAMRSDRQEDVAAFYRDTFGLTEVFRHISATNGRLAIYLTDGEINLAVIPGAGRATGIDHFGFQVDDVEATSAAALAAGAMQGATRVPQDGRQNEAFIKDPVGQRVDLSSAGWHHGGEGAARIRHVAFLTDDPSQLAAFYTRVFGLNEVARNGAGVSLSDGHVNLELLPKATAETPDARPGITSLGFHVDGERFSAPFVLDPQGQRVDLSVAGWSL